MALAFLGINNVPTYTAVSTDILPSNKITGANLPGKTIYLTDTHEWKFIREDYTLGDYVSATGGGGALNFKDLLDVPATYTGHAGKIPSVKSTEDGLEYVAVSDRKTAIYSSYYEETSILNLGTGSLKLSFKLLDESNLMTVDADTYRLHFGEEGWYHCSARVSCRMATTPLPVNGYISIFLQNSGIYDNNTLKIFTKAGEDYNVETYFNFSSPVYMAENETVQITVSNHTGQTMTSYCGELCIIKYSGAVVVAGY